MSGPGAVPPASRPRVGFVLEQTLGHVTHASNLQSFVPDDQRIEAAFAPIQFPVTGLAARLPGYRNWTVRAGLRARRVVTELRRDARLDALFVHTQVPAILIPDVMRRTPTVVSLDATPMQYDELGDHYGHERGGHRVERVKWWLNRACFRRAAAIVCWAEWTKRGLVTDYDVPADKISVIPPGVDTARWVAVGTPDAVRTSGDTTRVLFVGGDFARKGGAELVAAVDRLRADGVAIEVDIVTRDEVAERPGVHVHHGLGPNSDRLVQLYQAADVFCLPTLGDCLPMVLSEAAAVGLPLVSTDVGAIAEIVHHGRNGLLVPSGDTGALVAVLRGLSADPDLRRRMGGEARRVALAGFDSARNAQRLVDTILSVLRPETGGFRTS